MVPASEPGAHEVRPTSRMCENRGTFPTVQYRSYLRSMGKCQNASEASHEDAVAGVGEGLNAPDLIRVVMWESKLSNHPICESTGGMRDVPEWKPSSRWKTLPLKARHEITKQMTTPHDHRARTQ